VFAGWNIFGKGVIGWRGRGLSAPSGGSRIFPWWSEMREMKSDDSPFLGRGAVRFESVPLARGKRHWKVLFRSTSSMTVAAQYAD
jgi:hypothetical protein